MVETKRNLEKNQSSEIRFYFTDQRKRMEALRKVPLKNHNETKYCVALRKGNPRQLTLSKI